MQTFKALFLGCKVSSYTLDLYKDQLFSLGLIEDADQPDLILISTCIVTNTATNKGIKLIKKMNRDYPKAKIIVLGCQTKYLLDQMDELNISLITNSISDFKVSIAHLINHPRQIVLLDKDELKYSSQVQDRTRAFLRIQDGCNNFCSYCIVPYARGQEQSKPIKIIINELEHLISLGYQEIVLTGINTSNYGHDLNTNLLSLLKAIKKEFPNLYRLRISSLEMNVFSEEFITFIKETPNIARHFHIPLQAGSDRILKLMNRHYQVADFIDLCSRLKKEIPHCTLTTDLIVGFPSESQEEFETSLQTISQIGFLKTHVFPYSIRQGTIAASLPKQLSNQEKKNRARIAINFSLLVQDKCINELLSTNPTEEIIIEEIKDNYAYGHSSNYLYLKIPNQNYQPNQIVKVSLKDAIILRI